MKTLTLIDANSIIHRAFHALPPFTAPDGRATGALYGVSMMLLAIEAQGLLHYAAALFDRPEPTFRKERYAEYKGTRPKAAEPLVEQIIEAHTLFEKFGIRTFEKAGFEADDCIATLTERFKGENDIRIVILTGDMDTLQLIEDPIVTVMAFRKGVKDTVTYNEAAVRERLGVPVEAVTSYKALIGDTSDNIKGVPGIGPKTAAELLVAWGTLENIYANLESIDRGKEKLIAGREQALLSKELVTLRRDVPLELGRDVDSLAVNRNRGELRAYFETLGFTRLITRLDHPEGLPEAKKEPKKKKEKQRDPNQGTMF